MSATRAGLPTGFVVGTATAAYQVEGAVAEDGRGPSIWDDLAAVPGAIADGTNGEPADDQYHRFREDVALMASLGVDAYRFSISWSRIQPDGTGPANAAGVAFYRALVEELLRAGITPWVTLYHWDLPSALEAEGGWLVRGTAERFADYAGLVVDALGDLVDHWITLNEPWCSAFLGYASGVHAPGKRLGSAASHAAHHLLLGHGLAVRAIRARRPDATVGVTLNLYPVDPASGSAEDVDAARRVDGLQNRLFLEPVLLGRYPSDVLADLGETAWFAEHAGADLPVVAADVDFLGVNYYSRHTATTGDADPDAASANPGSERVRFVDTGAPRTAMGWEVHPDGLVEVLRMVNRLRPDLPLVITENGSAYDDVVEPDGSIEDEERRAYLEAHLAACVHAVDEGVPLTGYFAWSLLDNWEWAFGCSRRFGLVRVDYETQERTVKRSGRWLAEQLGGSLVQTATAGSTTAATATATAATAETETTR